jgi:hypothetical protein
VASSNLRSAIQEGSIVKHSRKAWSGGKPPKLSETDRAFLAHVEGCGDCAEGRWMFGHCTEGTRLYAAVQAQYKPAVVTPAIACTPRIPLRHGERGAPEDVDMNRQGSQLLGMAVRALRQLETGNPFAKIAVTDFRRAMHHADISEEYLATLVPLSLPLPGAARSKKRASQC